MKTPRIFALILSLALLGALCGCATAPAVSEPQSEPAQTTAAFTTAGSAASGSSASKTTVPAADQSDIFYPTRLFSSLEEFQAAYQACQKMSYQEYFSEPRYLFKEYQDYRVVKPFKDDPTKLVYTEENGQTYAEEKGKVYFDAKKYKKDAKAADGGYEGDDIIDFFRVDDEIWRRHTPSGTMDVVVKKHEGLLSVSGITSDVVVCLVENKNRTEKYPFDFRPEHYHVISKNMTIPYDDVPTDDQIVGIIRWFQKNVYNKK